MVDKIWYNMEELIGGSEERVLIETYWNVKIELCTYVRMALPGINRNILECKVLRYRSLLSGAYCINRNILECKVKSAKEKISNGSGINRNILECKVHCLINFLSDQFRINRNILECKDSLPPFAII